MTDYLEGKSLDQVIQKAEGYSLDVITSGRPVPHPADLLGTKAMHSLLDALRDEGCNVLDDFQDSEYGKFIHILDPEGNKVELWQPAAE